MVGEAEEGAKKIFFLVKLQVPNDLLLAPNDFYKFIYMIIINNHY